MPNAGMPRRQGCVQGCPPQFSYTCRICLRTTCPNHHLLFPAPSFPVPRPALQDLYEEALEGFLDLLDREIKVGRLGWPAVCR